MRVLKIGFVDTIEPIADFFVSHFATQFKVVRDDHAPDYLIFGDENFGQRNREENFMKVPVRIFCTGENRRPWDYPCHFSISFDHDTLDNRNYRLPLHVLANWHQVKTRVKIEKELSQGEVKTGNFVMAEVFEDARAMRRILDIDPQDQLFASFVVKNGSCAMRNDFFKKLSAYKQVDSAGPLFNNHAPLKQGEGGVYDKHLFLNKYKFNLCFENGSYPGYCTEKLFEALCAKTIPIYWGSPTAALDFNPNAFLNWHDFMDDELLLTRIKQLDEDDDAYMDMYLQPMFPNNTPPPHWDMNRFLFWWNRYVYR